MIDKTLLVGKITGSKEVKDYTYTILFLLISSFFAVFVIKPVLSIAVSLNKEAKELRSINTVFEKNINTVVTLQNQLQEIRSQAYLVDIAVPKDPLIQSLIEDIRTSAISEGIVVKTIEVTQPELEKDGVVAPATPGVTTSSLTAKPVAMKLVIQSDFDQAVRFIKTILNQRRLKTISKIALDKSESETGINYLTINLEVEGYHL